MLSSAELLVLAVTKLEIFAHIFSSHFLKNDDWLLSCLYYMFLFLKKKGCKSTYSLIVPYYMAFDRIYLTLHILCRM
jgi:hypothetical protein